MTFGINVQGGTGAGRKRPLKNPAKNWFCKVGHSNPGYATSCLRAGCKEKRSQ